MFTKVYTEVTKVPKKLSKFISIITNVVALDFVLDISVRIVFHDKWLFYKCYWQLMLYTPRVGKLPLCYKKIHIMDPYIKLNQFKGFSYHVCSLTHHDLRVRYFCSYSKPFVVYTYQIIHYTCIKKILIILGGIILSMTVLYIWANIRNMRII